jgi:hypothetical protein
LGTPYREVVQVSPISRTLQQGDIVIGDVGLATVTALHQHYLPSEILPIDGATLAEE